MNTSSITSSIKLHDLELSAYLGWLDHERLQKQLVTFDIHIQFSHPPKACETDHLTDTHCYDTLIKAIENYLKSHQFRLIEHLCHDIYQLIKHTIKHSASVSVRVTKKPMIPSLIGGASFTYGDTQ